MIDPKGHQNILGLDAVFQIENRPNIIVFFFMQLASILCTGNSCLTEDIGVLSQQGFMVRRE